MTREARKLLTAVLGVVLLGMHVSVLFAQDDAKAKAKADKPAVEAKAAEVTADDAAVDPKDIESKLLKLTTMEDAFLKSLRTVRLLRRFIVQENQKLQNTTDEAAKKQLTDSIQAARNRLQTLSNAMDVVFGIGRRRTYEYDSVKSTIYLRVGTVEEAFARSVRTRDALKRFIGQQATLKEAEQDEAKKKEIDNKIAIATRQWRTVAAALQLVYGVTPQRNYEYNPKNSTLYLKISENQLVQLRERLAKLQEEREAADEAPAAEAEEKK